MATPLSYFQIPLTNEPQTFQIELANITYSLTCKYNATDDAGWTLDIDNASSGDSIAANIPLITGGDCLAGLEYLGINGQLLVFTSGASVLDVPTLDNLGTDSFLYFATVVTDG